MRGSSLGLDDWYCQSVVLALRLPDVLLALFVSKPAASGGA